MPPEGWANPEVRDQHIDRLPQPQAGNVRETLGRLFSKRDPQPFISQLKEWVDWAAGHGEAIGTIGYCMGGRLSFLLAAHDHRPKAAVCNYGDAPSEEEMAHIEVPVYGFYGGTDHRITDQVPAVAESMKKLGKTYQYAIYPNAGHAFFNDSRVSYHVDAARDAWAKTLAFFDDLLG